MTDLVKLSSGKYTLYNVKSMYFENSDTGYRQVRNSVPRIVTIDWVKSIKYITRVGIDAGKPILDMDSIHKVEKKNIDEIQQDEPQEIIPAMSDQQFWLAIGKIRCCDKDEGRMNIGHIRINIETCRQVLSMINETYIPALKIALTDVPIMDGVSIDDYDNFLTHIIAKGMMFYNGIIENPVVSLYICDQFYPIHTWLNILAC